MAQAEPIILSYPKFSEIKNFTPEEHAVKRPEDNGFKLRIHQPDQIEEAAGHKNKQDWFESLREQYFNGPPWLQFLRDKAGMYLNYIGIALNSLAVIFSSSKILPEKFSKFIDEKSEWFSRYIIPISFGINGVEAFMGKRPLEMLARIVPALSFWALPFYNFNLATGISSGLNYLFELVVSRHHGKQPGEGSMRKNTLEIFKTSKEIFADILKRNWKKEKLTEQLATIFLLGGGIGGCLFTRDQRDSWAARFLGNIRNLGGILADKDLVFNKDKGDRSKDKRIVGSICGIASTLNIFMRWVNPDVARVLNHISIAADDFGLTYWAQSSKRDNDRQQTIKMPQQTNYTAAA